MRVSCHRWIASSSIFLRKTRGFAQCLSYSPINAWTRFQQRLNVRIKTKLEQSLCTIQYRWNARINYTVNVVIRCLDPNLESRVATLRIRLGSTSLYTPLIASFYTAVRLRTSYLKTSFLRRRCQPYGVISKLIFPRNHILTLLSDSLVGTSSGHRSNVCYSELN